MIRLFPNLLMWPKWPRRLTMLVVWPIVFVESVLNAIIGFPIDFYRCWHRESLLGN